MPNIASQLDAASQPVNSQRRFRMDHGHAALPVPHLFDLPNRYELQRLRMLLDDDDLDLQKLNQEVSADEGLQRYILAYANARLASLRNRVTDPVHAFAMLGINGLRRLLADLVESAQPAASA